MSRKPYPSNKGSGIEWLGHAPAHWPLIRLRFVARLNPSRSELAGLDRDLEVSFLPMEAIGEDGTLYLERTRPIGEVETGYSYMREGDVVLAKITPCFENGKGAIASGLHNGIAFGTTELIVARPRPDVCLGRFLHWLFVSPAFRKLGEASMYGAGGQKRVPDDFVRDFRVAFPPLPEQQAIAAFLDRETAKIDALVAEQERLIALLAEKRRAVISHAVTKGLDTNAPMKDSGIAWLGEVPAHWDLKRLKHFFRFIKRQEKAELPILSVYRDFGVIEKASRDDNLNKTPDDLSLYQTVEPSYLVINKMKAWQGSLGVSRLYGITSPDYAVFQPVHAEIDQFFNYFLRCQLLPDVYRSISNGIRPDQWRLEPDKLLQLELALPPREEQAIIVTHLDRETAKLDTLTAEAESAIALLKERRAALISAAVTGKIDVRDAVDVKEAAA